jgi:hypothetical protein
LLQFLFPKCRCEVHVYFQFSYLGLVGKSVGRRPLEKARHRWQDDIEMDLGEVGWVAWTGLIWLRMGADGVLLRMW